MKESSLKRFIMHASRECGPLSKVAVRCIKGGVVQSAPLQGALVSAGYLVEYQDGDHGAWARIYRKPQADEGKANILAGQGYSSTREDALLHAVYGAAREEDAKTTVVDWLKRAQVQVDDALRAKLEEQYIVNGGVETIRKHIEFIQSNK